MVEGYYPLENNDPVNPELRTLFQSVIGSLLYLMLGTRPDIGPPPRMVDFEVGGGVWRKLGHDCSFRLNVESVLHLG